MRKRVRREAALWWSAFVVLCVFHNPVRAQSDEALAEFARKAQDPLGDVKAIMTVLKRANAQWSGASQG